MKTADTSISLIARFCSDESGATAIEYALIASGIATAVAATVYSLGGTVKGMYLKIAEALS